MSQTNDGLARRRDRTYALLRRAGVAPVDFACLGPSLCRELFAFLVMTEPGGGPWHARAYQRDSLESRAARKVHCDGRDVGKTCEIEITAAWASLAKPHTQMLIATQTENHLFPLMHRLVRRFETTSLLNGNLAEVKRSPSWYLRFHNGFELWGRIAGPRGVNFQGMHVDWIIVDEAQEMTDCSWGELFQTLNGGGWRWVYGVPNGLRNMFYRMTQDADAEQYNWASNLNPDFTPEKDAELARLYGGRESPGYVHRVLGQHGAPAHGVFNLDDYLLCVNESVDFANVEIDAGDDFYAPPAPEGNYYLGCDLGYARDPSEFIVYRAEPPHLINVLRIHLRGVHYARQQEIIRDLDRAYAFQAIGIDCGNNGRAVAHNLMQSGVEWCDKLHAIDFGEKVDAGKMPDNSRDKWRAKEFMTYLLCRHMSDRSIVFPRLPDREAQYAGHTYAYGATGQIVYEKGNDHIIDADRCAVLAHYYHTRDEDAPPRPGIQVKGF
jgi:hypothetical protein